MRSHDIKNIIIVSLSILGLFSCAQEVDDLNTFIAETKKNSIGKVKPLPEYVAYKQFEYESIDIRDPFIPESVIKDLEALALAAAAEEDDDELAPDAKRKKELLESFPLDTLQMVGTLERDYKWALIRTSEGIVHRVKVGNYLGQNHGQIFKLGDTEVVINEVIKDGVGEWIERTSKLSIGQ